MVCAKCQKLSTTKLVTPEVKKKSEIYFGSPASSSKGAGTKSATLGNTGVTKSKLLSKAAKNPYAQYSSSCTKCKTKVSQGYSYCNKCAYQADACAMCGKANKKSNANAPVISGQKFTLK